MTDQNNKLPSLNRILYDERFGTSIRYGLGPEQIFVDADLARETILEILSDPNRDFQGVDIDAFFETIDFDTPQGIINTMNSIYDDFSTEDVNYIFFRILEIALSLNTKFEDILKTSWVSLKVRAELTQQASEDIDFVQLEEDGLCPDDPIPPSPTPPPTP